MDSGAVRGTGPGRDQDRGGGADARGAHRRRARLNSRAGTSGDTVAADMVRAVHGALKSAGTDAEALRGVGIGAPGPLDWKAGVIHFAPNLGMRNYPLRLYIEERLGVPVFLDNDVNMGTYGEYLAGAARGQPLRAGRVLRHRHRRRAGGRRAGFRGANGTAGEIGHIIVHDGGALCAAASGAVWRRTPVAARWRVSW